MSLPEGLPGTIAPLDEAAMAGSRSRLDRLTKPPRSLGRLERLATQLSGITGHTIPRVDRPAIVVFAGDHGVARRDVSAYPSEVTAQMMANFIAGGAAVNALARVAGATVVAVDVGVAAAIPVADRTADRRGARFVSARVAAGTRDFTIAPAMTAAETEAAILVGRSVAAGEVAAGANVVAVGEMGIGNTTAASALVAAMTSIRPDLVTGAGTGLDERAIAAKVRTVEAALELHRPDPAAPFDVLARLGGLEIASLVGAILECVRSGVPVVLDGFITGAAALLAAGIAPGAAARMIASHRSPEPGHRVVLERLDLEPLLDLEMRLGEASGAALVLPIVRAAGAIVAEMATFDEAGVAGPASGAGSGGSGPPAVS